MILADTQSVAWLTLDQKRLSARAVSAISDAHVKGTGLAVAGSTLWELAMLVDRGGIRPSISLSAYLDQVQTRFTVLPLTAAIAERSIRFTKEFPKDPTDRIIAATAVVHGLSLVTSDAAMRKSGEVPCIW